MRGTTSIEERTRSDSVLRDRTNSSSTKTSILNDEEELEEDERAITVAKEFEDLKNKKKKYERTIIDKNCTHCILQLNVQADLLLEGEHNITTCFGLHSFNTLERVCF